jgi:anti-anti-sigma factor
MINSFADVKGRSVIFANFARSKNKKVQFKCINNDMMNTTIQEKDGNLIAFFEGRLDTAAAIKTEQDVKPLYDNTEHDIILDCTALEYISSSGLRIFLAVLKNAKAKGSHVYIRNINEGIQKVFKMTGFYNLFEFKE